MYSSPATPAGTGHSHWSSTYTRVLSTGAPTGGACPSGVMAAVVATMTVASVGPYVFMNRRPGAHAAARPAVSASPPASSLDTPASSAGSSTASSEGTTLAACTPAPRTSAASSAGSARAPPRDHQRPPGRQA